MNIADRIQGLRKTKGLSQEDLADKIGVSRQAVSKWESEQSIPDIDKIIIMSEFFEVSTDYILKGIEAEKPDRKKVFGARICVIIATALNLLGLVISCAIWYEKQNAFAIMVGFIFMVLGCIVFGIGISGTAYKEKAVTKRRFYSINIWLLSFMPLSILYNLLLSRMIGPYPLLYMPLIAFPIFWLVYVASCLTFMLALKSRFSAEK